MHNTMLSMSIEPHVTTLSSLVKLSFKTVSSLLCLFLMSQTYLFVYWFDFYLSVFFLKTIFFGSFQDRESVMSCFPLCSFSLHRTWSPWMLICWVIPENYAFALGRSLGKLWEIWAAKSPKQHYCPGTTWKSSWLEILWTTQDLCCDLQL